MNILTNQCVTSLAPYLKVRLKNKHIAVSNLPLISQLFCFGLIIYKHGLDNDDFHNGSIYFIVCEMVLKPEVAKLSDTGKMHDLANYCIFHSVIIMELKKKARL